MNINLLASGDRGSKSKTKGPGFVDKPSCCVIFMAEGQLRGRRERRERKTGGKEGEASGKLVSLVKNSGVSPINNGLSEQEQHVFLLGLAGQQSSLISEFQVQSETLSQPIR